jgi:tetratricopeptide (TPR) repeat protein
LLVAAGLLGAAYGFGWYHFQAAEQSLGRDFYSDARKHLAWCEVVWPRSYAVNMRQARVERLDQQFEACESHLKTAMAIHGGATEETQLEFLLLRCQRGEVDEVAPGLLDAARNGHPDASGIFQTLVITLVDQGRYGEASLTIGMWREQDPDSVAALELRGFIASQLNRSTDALDSYSRAVELDPDRLGARLRLVDLYLNEINLDAAEVHIRYLQSTRPQDINVRFASARYLFLLGKEDEASELLDQIWAEVPKHLPTLLTRAKLELQRGRPAEAEKWCQRALEVNAYDTEAQFTLYRSLQAQHERSSEANFHKKRYEELKAAYQQIQKTVQRGNLTALQHPDQMAELGRLYLEVGQDVRGLKWLYTVLRIDPRHRAANAALAAYYERNNESEKAERHRQASR